MNWAEIARRAQEATGPDEHLDAIVWGAVGGPSRGRMDYTASVDATLALISERLPGGAYTICRVDDKAVWKGKPHRAMTRVFTADPDCEGFEGKHATSVPLALIAAFALAMNATGAA